MTNGTDVTIEFTDHFAPTRGRPRGSGSVRYGARRGSLREEKERERGEEERGQRNGCTEDEKFEAGFFPRKKLGKKVNSALIIYRRVVYATVRNVSV